MIRSLFRFIAFPAILIAIFSSSLWSQRTRARTTPPPCNQASELNGVYRIDVDGSDKLYSVIEEAQSSVPFAQQQQFFIDLAVRLTPPDFLAIECSGSRISLASSRAPRVDFQADGTNRTARQKDGRVMRTRIAFERGSLSFQSGGGNDDNLSFTFTPIENGTSLRVTRRISARELIEPVVIRTIYNKISETARWDIFDENQAAAQIARQNVNKSIQSNLPRQRTASGEINEAGILREALDQWIEATNERDIERQMAFYMPLLKAFYLTRNASRNSVRAEKNRAFATARSIDIRAEEPEIIFQDTGRTAIMRFRKKYSVVTGARTRSGEVIQELRWQRANDGWKIFSERDIRVLR